MSHDQQAKRLREIDDLLAECQRHDMTGVRVSYAQLRALRDAIAAPVPPAAVNEVPDALDENEYQDVWNSAFAAGWNDCRKKMLAAAQAQEGGR